MKLPALVPSANKNETLVATLEWLPKLALIVSLYIPWLLATVLQAAPMTSYWIAWLGSFYIFYQTWFSSYRFVLPDLPIHQQIMRPVFLQQAIFAGFMCCTSIFYLLDTLGYQYLEQVNIYNPLSLQDSLALIAKCQRISLFGHAALVTGILLTQSRNYFRRPVYNLAPTIPRQVWIIRISILSLLVSILIQRVPAMSQFSIGLYNIAVFGGAVVFVKGVTEKKLNYLIWGGGIFILNIINSTLTGFKEPIIINFIIIGCLIYPYYKKLVLISAIPILLILLYFSSSYTSAFRKQAWQGDATAEEARTEAIEALLENVENEPEEMEESNWDFFAHRFSELGMFTEFARQIPDVIPYYDTQLLENALFAIIPRALWAEKPVTESLAMERVYVAGIVSRNSNVSAKTRPVVDGYLSAGLAGVAIYMFFLGVLSQSLNNKAERLFGGYGIGCVIFYNGFFQQLWRGETIEFLLNTVFWSFITMLALHSLLKYVHYLVRLKRN